MVQTRNMSRSLVILPWTLAGVLVVAFASKLYVTFGGSATAPNAARGQMVTMRARGDSTKTKAYLVESLVESGQAVREPEQLPWGAFLGVVAAAAAVVGVAMSQTPSNRNPMQATFMSSSTSTAGPESFARVNRGVELADSVVRPRSVPDATVVTAFKDLEAVVKQFGKPAENFKVESEKAAVRFQTVVNPVFIQADQAIQAVTANVTSVAREINQAAGWVQASLPKFQQDYSKTDAQAGIGFAVAASIAAQATRRSPSVSAPARTSVVSTPPVVQGKRWNRSSSAGPQMRSAQQTAQLRQLLLNVNPVPVYP